MDRPKVLIIGRENFQNIFCERAFPNCTVARCKSQSRITSTCSDRDLIVIEERYRRGQLPSIFRKTRREEGDFFSVERRALNPFHKERKRMDRKRIILPDTIRICFIWSEPWDKIYQTINGATGYLNPVDISKGNLEFIFFPNREQKTSASY